MSNFINSFVMANIFSMSPNLKGFVDRLHALSGSGLWFICSVSVCAPVHRSQSVLLYPAFGWVSFADGDVFKIILAAHAFNLTVHFISEQDLPIIQVTDYFLK